MNYNRLFIEVSRISHDLVFSPSEVTPDLSSLNRGHEILSLKKYEENYIEFTTEGVNQKRQLILRRVAEEWQIVIQKSFEVSLKILNSVANVLLLNELEVVYWSCLLKAKFEGMKPSLFAYFTAYLSKLNLNNDVYSFEAYLNSVIPNFRVHFNNWQLVTDFSCEVTIQILNSRYNYLSDLTRKTTKDYESMVQELMHIPRRKEGSIDIIINDTSLNNIESGSLDDYELDLLEYAKSSPIDNS